MNKPQPYHLFRQTVLVTPNSNNPTSQNQKNNKISSDHPLFYVQQKNYFLQQLSNKVSVQSKFDSIDLKRNARIDHLISKHQSINKEIQKQKKRKNMFLNSNQYKPILGMNQEDKRRIKQQKQAQRLREQLYQNYVEQCNMHQEPQRDTYNSSINQLTKGYQQYKFIKQQQNLKNFTVLSDYRSDPNKRKQLYLLDLQIAKLQQQQKLQKLAKNKLQSCSNNQLLSKISNTIISSYMVYFDEIFNSLIDQILQEEVINLNSLEAEFYQGQKKRKDPIMEVKAVKMMELVKALDELAYD